MLDIFRNLPKLKSITQNIGINSDDFILLTEMYYNSEKYYTTSDIKSIMGESFEKNLKTLSNNDYIFCHNKQYNISTKGILIVGEVMSKFLDNIYLP